MLLLTGEQHGKIQSYLAGQPAPGALQSIKAMRRASSRSLRGRPVVCQLKCMDEDEVSDSRRWRLACTNRTSPKARMSGA